MSEQREGLCGRSLGSELVEVHRNGCADRIDDGDDAILHASGADEGDFHYIVLLLEYGPNQPLTCLNASNQCVKETLIDRRLIGRQSPEVLASIASPRRFGHVEGQKRASILFRHSNEHGARWLDITGFQVCQSVRWGLAVSGTNGKLRGCFFKRKARSFPSPSQNVWIHVRHRFSDGNKS